MTDDLTIRLNRLKTMNFTYQDKSKIVIEIEKYITIFKKMMHVKTLRPPTKTDKPLMYFFGNGYFEKGAESYLKETNYALFGPMMNKHLNSELTHRLQADTYVDKDYFEGIDFNLLNVKNGVLNLRTGEFTEHDSKHRMTTILPVEFNPDAEYGFFVDFVKQIVDVSDRKVIQEMFGYCLYRDYFIQKAFMLTGQGANGKGVLLYCLKELLGKDNCSAVNLVALSNNRFMKAQLHTKYANISNETPSGQLSKTDIFKSLRGGDLIPAENKFGQPFIFINYAKLIFSTNKIPESLDDTFAFWRSWIVLKFPYTFVGKDCNKNLKYELTTPERLSGILNYGIEGLKRLFENQEFSYSKSTEEVREEWKRSADTTLAFIHMQVAEEPDNRVKTNDLLNAYFKFCSEYNLKPESERGFWKNWRKHIKEYCSTAERRQEGDGSYYWKDIKLLE